MAAADFFFLSERTNFLFFIQISNKFRENPSSPSAVRVVVDTKYNTHTHSINNTTTTTTCRTTKVAVPLLMSTSTTIYSPVQTCVLFNVIVSRVNSRFCSCCVCWYFSLRQRTRASSSSSSLTLLLLMKNNLKHTVRCCHQVQDCCRLREWYVFIKLFFFLLVFVSWGGPIRNTFQPPFSDEERKQYSA